MRQLELMKGLNSKKGRKGKLIVIEGSDGSGKATQLHLLKDYLTDLKIPVRTIDFPGYKTSFYGKMIAEFLRGEYGKLENVHPFLISVIYALDRAQAKKKLDLWLRTGDIVLANRYTTSNMAHQTARLPDDKKEEFLKWIEELEYKLNKIPREDLVIYLYMPFEVAKELILKKSKEQREYAHGKARDMVEEDTDYLKKSERVYLDLVGRFTHWVKINCVDERGNLKTKEEIHLDVVRVLEGKGMI